MSDTPRKQSNVYATAAFTGMAESQKTPSLHYQRVVIEAAHVSAVLAASFATLDLADAVREHGTH